MPEVPAISRTGNLATRAGDVFADAGALARNDDAFEARPQLSWEEMNAEFVHELRWWTLEEIAASDAHFVPNDLHTLVVTVLRDGPPADSVDVST